MKWEYKRIRKTSWDTVFKKGWKPWLLLVAVCFFFSMIGAQNSLQAEGLDYIDQWLGYKDANYEANVGYLKDYVADTNVIKSMPKEVGDMAVNSLDSIAASNSWVVRVLAHNAAYFERNPGEVIANIVIIGVIMFIVKFFILDASKVGLYRYVLENRQQEKVRFRRLFAPFHLKMIPHVIWLMFRYSLVLIKWYMVFIIPGIYKTYQFSMIPYIIAENPTIKWKDAVKLTKSMTKGYKWKMFVTDLSYIYIWLLHLIPIAGLLVSVPLSLQLDAEYYFTLRNRSGIDHTHLPEQAFSGAPYVKRLQDKKREPNIVISAPEYVLEDVNTKTAHRKGLFRFDYSPFDIVFMFFSFCMVGWIWEVCYEFVDTGLLVNRGTMYGPWIPIYGFGGIAIVLLLSRFKENKIKLFLMTMLVCAILEYLGSFALEFMFNSSYWDYKEMFMNVNGRICLAGLMAFGVGGLFGVYIAGPAISRFVDRFKRRTQFIVAGVLAALFITDIICCAIFGFNTGAAVGGKIV
ncbi:MAG: DUF975 family protein [Clostridiales bacterium]|nr:DUF975 family protein [Clostridiales bacterium]